MTQVQTKRRAESSVDEINRWSHQQQFKVENEDASISSLRCRLEQKLLGEEFKPLINVVLDRTSWILQKIVHRPVPFWTSALTIALSILATSLLISLVRSEYSSKIRIDRFPSEVALVGLVFVGFVLLKQQLDQIYRTCRNNLIHHIESTDDLNDLECWFLWVSKQSSLLVGATIGGLITGLLAVWFVCRERDGFIGFGPTVLDILVNILAIIAIYYVVGFINLAHRLGGYHFRLFSIDPRKSEVIHYLSAMLFGFVRSTALFVAAISLIIGLYAVIKPSVIVILLVIGWGPIIIAFLLSQSTLSKIISTEKWQAVDEVQKKLELLRRQRDITDENFIKESERLLALHDRIWATSNLVIDLKGALSFVNALLLPIASFIIGQLPGIVSAAQKGIDIFSR